MSDPPAAPSALGLLATMLATATQELQDAAGGRPLCRVATADAPSRAIKHLEGRCVALQSLAAAVGADPRPQYAVVTADALHDRWRLDLDRWSRQAGSSWIPYTEGGLEALGEARAVLAR